MASVTSLDIMNNPLKVAPEVRDALQKLITTPGDFTFEDLQDLVDSDAVPAFWKKIEAGETSGQDRLSFIVPGVFVWGAVHTCCLRSDPQNPGKVRIEHSYCHNAMVMASYAHLWDEVCSWQGRQRNAHTLLSPVNRSGNKKWDWFQANPVKDPSRRILGKDPEPKYVDHGMQEGRPVVVAQVAFVFEKGKGPNDRQTHFRWDKQAEDRALLLHSQHTVLWYEVMSACKAQGAAPTNYCAYCGHSLHMTGCGHCDYLYRDNGFDTGGGPPIDPQAQALVEACGWTFTTDPQKARNEADARYAERTMDYAMLPSDPRVTTLYDTWARWCADSGRFKPLSEWLRLTHDLDTLNIIRQVRV